MSLSKKLPTWVCTVALIVFIAVITFTAWQALAMLREIRQTGEQIAELSNQILPTSEFIEQEPAEESSEIGFCGWATEGPCAADEDCMISGCSGQVCQSKNEEPVITTCEYTECYDVAAYGVECKCIADTCQWE